MPGSYLKQRMRGTKLFKWRPDADVLVAFATLYLMWASYYGMMKIDWYSKNTVVLILLFVILTSTVMAVIFPVWWVVRHRKKSISELGITKKYILFSLLLSAAVAAWRGASLPSFITTDFIYYLPTFVASALIFWEPFFVFGWLQTRYEKSFGTIPAIVLAASSIIFYQIGSVPSVGLVDLIPVCLVLATTFSLTKSIFTLWPIYWCIGSSVNQLSLGMHSSWDIVAVYAVAIFIQFAAINYLRKKKSSRKK